MTKRAYKLNSKIVKKQSAPLTKTSDINDFVCDANANTCHTSYFLATEEISKNSKNY